MLDQLIIEDFQIHQRLTINLDPGVTTIVGPSDVGKSAIVRALIWLATNRPRGDSFIRDGGGSARVTLHLDGHEIVRTRGKSDNTYSLDGEELRAFGNDVPEGVRQLLNLSDINFQHQHDSPFWFSRTAGEVSRQLNQIVDLSIIDRTLANLDKANRAATADVESLKRQEEEAKVTRRSLSWVRMAGKALREIETLEERRDLATRRHRDATERVRAVRLHRDLTKSLRQQEKWAETALEIGYGWEKIRTRRMQLKEMIHTIRLSRGVIKQSKAIDKVLQLGEKWEMVRGQKTRLDQQVQELSSLLVESERSIPDLTDLVLISEAAISISRRVKLLREIVGAVRAAESWKESTDQKAQEVEEEFHRQLGEECPLCGQTL